jgi:hypothetical protein
LLVRQALNNEPQHLGFTRRERLLNLQPVIRQRSVCCGLTIDEKGKALPPVLISSLSENV